MNYRKGPYIVEGHVIRAGDGTLIADLRRKAPSSVFESHIGNAHLSVAQVSDIADLLAAAPKLLEACKIAWRIELDDEMSAILAAAIAEATGK